MEAPCQARKEFEEMKSGICFVLYGLEKGCPGEGAIQGEAEVFEGGGRADRAII